MRLNIFFTRTLSVIVAVFACMFFLTGFAKAEARSIALNTSGLGNGFAQQTCSNGSCPSGSYCSSSCTCATGFGPDSCGIGGSSGTGSGAGTGSDLVGSGGGATVGNNGSGSTAGASASSFDCGPGFTKNSMGICIPTNSSGGFASSTNLVDTIVSIIKYLLYLIGIIAVVLIIIGGYWYVTSAGNEDRAEKGKSTLVNAVIGLVVAVLAYAIVTVIVNTLTRGTV